MNSHKTTLVLLAMHHSTKVSRKVHLFEQIHKKLTQNVTVGVFYENTAHPVSSTYRHWDTPLLNHGLLLLLHLLLSLLLEHLHFCEKLMSGFRGGTNLPKYGFLLLGGGSFQDKDYLLNHQQWSLTWLLLLLFLCVC